MAQATIVILDEHIGQRVGGQVRSILQRESRYRALLERPARTAVESLSHRPDLIVSVLRSLAEPRTGAASTDIPVPWLAVVGADSVGLAVDPPSVAPWDFVLTPLREAEVLARAERLLGSTAEHERVRIRATVTQAAALGQLVGEAPAFAAVKRRIPLLARSDAPPLITGETGTGKELCARAVHYLSPRAGRPFLPVNCGAIPLELFESELFGHEKGAFTGASATRAGLVAEAEGGTLFLDEIETLSLGAQVKLLRFLEDHTYHVLGSPRPRRSDVRILAATNASLGQRVRDGAFREDLLYRLNVLTVALPPLRERRGDVALLARHFLARFAEGPDGQPRRLSAAALEALSDHRWPGNVRELQNVVHQAVVLAEAPLIEAAHLSLPEAPAARGAGAGSMRQAKARVVEEFEKAYLGELLRAHQGNVTQAARDAQKERRAFGRLVKKYFPGRGAA
jgi:DNA-binding NtrC family response regulator